MTSVESPFSHCRFGLALADITPPVGIYHRMWGAASHDRSAGVHRPLRASVMIFQQSGKAALAAATLQVVVALDHCLLDGREVSVLKETVCAETKLPVEAIVVVFSHTHAAGLMSRERSGLPGGELIPGYLDDMHAIVARLAKEAHDRLVDVTITYGLGSCRLAANRDFRDPLTNEWVCGLNPDVPADDTVVVARVTDAADRTVATLVNYACHPTTLAWQNQLISPDYVGAMREVVEDATGAPCVFLQGASGDLGPREGFVADVAVADRNGRQLGYAALTALTALPPPNQRYRYRGSVVSGATLGQWEYEPLDQDAQRQACQWQVTRTAARLPYRPELPSVTAAEEECERLRLAEAAARAAGTQAEASNLRALLERQTRLLARLRFLPQEAYPYGIVVWNVGAAVWCAVQGEPYNLLQTELRRRFPQTPLVIAVLADSWGASYLPPARLYGTGIYQESIAVLGAGALEQVIEETARIISVGLAGPGS